MSMRRTFARLKHRPFWIAGGVAFVLLVIYLSVTSHPLDVPSWWNFKIGHILAYAWLMFWFAQIWLEGGKRLATALVLLAMGIALEYVQGMIGRDFAYSDMRDDGIGIAAGWLLAVTPLGRSFAFVEHRLAP